MLFRCPSQGGDLCSPEGRTCIEENSRRNFSCSANCEGVYLDIWKTQEDNVATDEHEIPETETESLPEMGPEDCGKYSRKRGRCQQEQDI